MHLAYVERVVDFKAADEPTRLRVDCTADDADARRSPYLNVSAGRSDADHASEHTVAETIDVVMVEYLAILYFLPIYLRILKLCRNGYYQPWGSGGYDSIHHNLVGTLIIYWNLRLRASIHEERGYQNDERACEQHANVRGIECSIAVLFVNAEDAEDLLVRQLVELWELAPETLHIFILDDMLGMPALPEAVFI